MKFPWWIRSWTIWSAALAIAMTAVPMVREGIHEYWLNFMWAQACLHALLRFKTEHRATKLSEG